MNQRIKSIIDEARKLSRDERLELFDQLEAEFHGDKDEGTAEEIEAAWMTEAERRIGAGERGETSFVGHDQVMAGLRSIIERK